tara:strand:+ start:7429 stop:8499 length:1071 start_codon:yes stop_codon:yes gene_type:complete
MKQFTVQSIFYLAAATALAACGGGGSSGSGNPAAPAPAPAPETGTLSGAITDAAVDEVIEVNLRVTALELRQGDDAGQDPVVIDLTDPDTGEPMTFNLLDYQNGETLELFDGEEIPAGTYEQVRLVLEAPAQTPNACDGQDPLLGSYVVEDDMGTLAGIFVPSGANNGIRLSAPFEVPAGGSTAIVVDFDLRQSLHRPPPFDCYFLRPSYRIVETEDSGAIAGTVDVALMDGSNAMCSDDDPATGNAVYLYEGAGQTPGDLNGDDADASAEPFATAAVTFDPLAGNAGEGAYRIGFLPPGEYTAAFTCAADLERNPDPEGETEDERLAIDDLMFQQPQDVPVDTGVTSTADFTPEA